MRANPDLTVVVPAYNEEARLERTVREAVGFLRGRGSSFELLIVDDGSTDGTSALATALGDEIAELRLIRLPVNAGKGMAVRTGVVNARGRSVLFVDADGATPIGELERLEAAVAAGADIAVGSRAFQDRGVRVEARLYRRVMGRTFHWFVRRLAVRGIEDTQCGFKLFQAGAAHDLFSRMRMRGFSFDVEVLMMAQRRGYTVAEVPVNWVHQPGSRVNLVADSLRMLRDVFVIRRHMMSGAYSVPHLTPLVPAPVSRPSAEAA